MSPPTNRSRERVDHPETSGSDRVGELVEDFVAMARFLGQHFGGGLVYLQEPADAALLGLARKLSFVDAEGYLTVRGKHFWLQSTA